TISGNSARIAGAIYVQNNSSSEFTNVKFTNNSSTSAGGALYVAGSATYTATPKLMDNCEFTNNFSSGNNGGGIYVGSYSSLSSVNTIFSGNYVSSGSGGAIYAIGNAANPTTVTLTGGRFSGNTASASGGVAYIS